MSVGNYRLHMMTMGKGSPAVIFEAGAGDDSTTWRQIPEMMAQFTSVCVYDRAGLGQSDSAPRPCTAASLEGPYVLVGHSLGALISRLYAQYYPQDVVGMALIDGPHPDQGNRFAAALIAAGYIDHKGVQAILEAARGVDPEYHPEGLDFAASLTQVDTAHTFGDIPLVIITAGKPPAWEDSALPIGAALVFHRAWHEMQADLVKLSAKGMHIIAKQSGHYIHWDEPGLVIEAIRQVVMETRKTT